MRKYSQSVLRARNPLTHISCFPNNLKSTTDLYVDPSECQRQVVRSEKEGKTVDDMIEIGK